MQENDLKPINQLLNTEQNLRTWTSQVQETACADCGETIRIMKMPILGGSRKGELQEFRSRCFCTDRPLAEEAEKDRAMKMYNKALEIFDRFSLVPPELQLATFENYKPKNEQMLFALRLCKRYVEVFNKQSPKNLLIYGSFGVGKSHLAVAMQQELMKKGITCIFVFLPDLLDMFTDSYNKNSEVTEGEIMKSLKSVDVLVIDDLGAEGTLSDFGKRKLVSIVNGRQGKDTHFTSNFGPEQLYEFLGERIFSRIMNPNTETCEIDGENHRLMKFMQKRRGINE